MCPYCKNLFKHRQSKYNHMKNNICKNKYINNSECNRNNEDINLDIESNEK